MVGKPPPPWAPPYLSFAGRPKYPTASWREKVWHGIAKATGVSHAHRHAALLALRWQEDHLVQVRALLVDVEMYRRTELPRRHRDDWQRVVEQWLVYRLAHSRRAQCTSTVFRWAVTVAPRLPVHVSATAITNVVRGLAVLRSLRPSDRLRDVSAAVRRALETAATSARSSLLAAAVYMAVVCVAQGWRLADAVRVVTGELSSPLEWITDRELAVFPATEKTDHFGLREVEPSVVVFPDGPLATSVVSRLPYADAVKLESEVAGLLHRSGVRDVRAARRDAAAAAGSRAAAAPLLRHAPGSAVTARYATTRDAMPRARAVARKVSFAIAGE